MNEIYKFLTTFTGLYISGKQSTKHNKYTNKYIKKHERVVEIIAKCYLTQFASNRSLCS